MTITGLLRILFRWQKWAWGLLAVMVPAAVIMVFLLPLKYEAQMILERKPTNVTSGTGNQEFDMIRLTAETQRNVALLKSRFILEQWYEALAFPAQSDRKKEKNIKRLVRSLSVRPINFTDMVIIKVKDKSPEAAKAKTLALAQVYSDWDKKEAEAQADKLIELLNERMEKVRAELAQKRTQRKRFKTVQTLQLSGSVRESTVETEIAAKEKLYDELTLELEEAARRTDKKSLERIHFVTQPSASTKPVYSRTVYFALALSLCLVFVFAAIFVLEWVRPTVRRAGDILHAVPSSNVILVTEGVPLKTALGPVVHWCSKIINEKGAAIVQWLHVGPPSSERSMDFGTLISLMQSDRYKSHVVRMSDSEKPLGSQWSELKKQFGIIFVETELAQGAAAGAQILPEADIVCLSIVADRTLIPDLKIIQTQIDRVGHLKTFYILNRVQDPLPAWLSC